MSSIVFSIAFQLFVFSQSPSFIYIFFKVPGHIRNYYFEVHDLCFSYIIFLGPYPIGSLGSEESTLSWLFMCVCVFVPVSTCLELWHLNSMGRGCVYK